MWADALHMLTLLPLYLERALMTCLRRAVPPPVEMDLCWPSHTLDPYSHQQGTRLKPCCKYHAAMGINILTGPGFLYRAYYSVF